MRKKILPLALLVGIVSISAQNTHVDKDATFYVKEKALVYHGGGVQTKGTGKIYVEGNVMIDGASSDTFRTLDDNGSARTVGAQNIVLRMNSTDNTSYGQLYVTGIPQNNMTGFVTKEYRATSHGAFQQMALPFYDTPISDFAKILGYRGFSNQRGVPSVFYWDNNGMPQFHHLLANQTTMGRNEARDGDIVQNSGAARYYIITANNSSAGANWDPSSVIKNFEGQIFSDFTPISYTLTNAGYDSGGSPVAYGVGRGRSLNNHGELIYTYLSDAWDFSSHGFFNKTTNSENGTYGRNIYQFGNPFMTNIDLSTIGYIERSNNEDDGNTISSIQGVRYEAAGVALGITSEESGTPTRVNGATSYKYINYENGVPTGDIDNAIVRPMQTFVIKLKDNSNPQTLNFNKLRRFSDKARKVSGGQAVNSYGVNSERNVSSTVKQLRVIGFDENGVEVGRTYFILSKNAKTGAHNGQKLQVIASDGTLTTREELPTGGEDTTISGEYWLYANEANEEDFVGKKIQMVADIDKIKKYQFQIAENAQSFDNGQTDFVNGGKSFYIQQGNGNVVRLSHNMVLDAVDYYAGLYYGVPEQETQLSTQNTKAEANSDLYVAFEKDTRTHQVVFPKGWKKADITVFDMAGRRVVVEKEVDATRNFVLPISVQGSYIVEVVSNTGIKAVKKIVK